MHRSEAEFCRDQAERVHDLAGECDDPQLRAQLLKMAAEWARRAEGRTATAAGN